MEAQVYYQIQELIQKNAIGSKPFWYTLDDCKRIEDEDLATQLFKIVREQNRDNDCRLIRITEEELDIT